MPLSEHEQKILTDLEESLRQQDPQFLKNVRKVNFRIRRWRSLSITGFLTGLAVLTAFFTESIPLGLVGLAVMLGSSLIFASHVAQIRHS
jgi:hypothetical protein